MKILNVIVSSFRTLVEEQDDTIVWLVQSLRKAGAETSVLLSGNAVYYTNIKTAAPALSIGTWTQKTPANVARDIQALAETCSGVYVVTEDIVERALDSRCLAPGVTMIARKDLVGLYDQADTVWHW